MENHGGTLCAEESFLKHNKECQDQSETQWKKKEAMQAAKEQNREKFLALFLANCDERRHSDSLEDSENNFMPGDDKHPKTLQKACKHLMNCKKFKPKDTK